MDPNQGKIPECTVEKVEENRFRCRVAYRPREDKEPKEPEMRCDIEPQPRQETKQKENK